MNRRVCMSYKPCRPSSTLDLRSDNTSQRAATLDGTSRSPFSYTASSSTSPSSITSIGSSTGYYTQKQVHFEVSSARKALSTIKVFTTKSFRSIKEHYKTRHQRSKLPHDVYQSNWISDAANGHNFSTPRSFKPPLRSCIRRQPSCATSMRSIALRNELNCSDIESSAEGDICLIDNSVDQTLINGMWVPLNPTQYVPLCIDDIKDLFR